MTSIYHLLIYISMYICSKTFSEASLILSSSTLDTSYNTPNLRGYNDSMINASSNNLDGIASKSIGAAPLGRLQPLPLPGSTCACEHNSVTNIIRCAPFIQDPPQFLSPPGNNAPFNMSLSSCAFTSNHITLPSVNGSKIDYLKLMDINLGGYIVFDKKSFASYEITNVNILCNSNSDSKPTMLLISNDAFTSLPIISSLRRISIKGCYLLPLEKPFATLNLLQSIELIDIEKFSWFDIRKLLKDPPVLELININQTQSILTADIFNALSCDEIKPQWNLNFRLIQTCSCKLMKFIETVQLDGNDSRCPNALYKIQFVKDVCQFNGRIYKITNQTNLFCNKCLSYECPDNTVCAEAIGSEPKCIALSRYDYENVRSRIPMTSYTSSFLFQESQHYLTLNTNNTLEPQGFRSVATVLVDAIQNPTENSPTTVRLYHETISQMLSQSWAPEVFASEVEEQITETSTISSMAVPGFATISSVAVPGFATISSMAVPGFATISSVAPSIPPSTKLWQQLIVSIDNSAKKIDTKEAQYVYFSKSISTMSLRISTDEKPKENISWIITSDNKITENIADIKPTKQNVTTRVFLNILTNQSYDGSCNISNSSTDCTNRYSITAIKANKLFYKTDRVPQYDVISITAPSQNQSVTFEFDSKVSSNEGSDYLINQTNPTPLDSFYNRADSIIAEGTCMYLNTTTMIWQTDGCFTDRRLSTSTSVTCTCEHLTMFTVFFSLSCEAPAMSLKVLTWLGCIFSIISLLITFFMFIVMSLYRQTKTSIHGGSSSSSSTSHDHRRKTTNKSPHLSIVKCMLFILCILLILMNIFIFILSFVKPGQKLVCKILSSALYYFTLTAFIWKLLFALQQSLFLTNNFKLQWSDQTLFTIYIILTFSIPVLPLLIMFFKYEKTTFISSTCDYCWLSQEFLKYGLVIPIIIIICLNIIFYLYTMIYLCMRNRQQLGLRSTKSEQSRRIQNFKIGIFFAIIMGFSWILGFLVLIPNSSVQFFGNILFCIVNAFQGFAFFIMVFFMIERKSFIQSCREFWRREKQRNIIFHSQSIIQQESLPMSSDNGTTKRKNRFNSSIYTTSTTSGGDNNVLEIYDHYRHRKLLTEKEIDEYDYLYNLSKF